MLPTLLPRAAWACRVLMLKACASAGAGVVLVVRVVVVITRMADGVGRPGGGVAAGERRSGWRMGLLRRRKDAGMCLTWSRVERMGGMLRGVTWVIGPGDACCESGGGRGSGSGHAQE